MPTPTDSQAITIWVAILTMVGTLLGLILGFSLNEVSYLMRTRREDRRTISKTLAELLDVRHLLKYLPLTVEALKKALPGPIAAHDEVMLRHVLWTLIPNTEGMQKRYEDAVSAVSAFLPVLAFDLRSKDMIGPLLGRLRGTIPIEPNAAPFWLKMEDEVVRFAIPKLEESIQELANLHRRKTAKEVRTLLKKPFEPPQELTQFLTETFTAMAAAAQAQAEAQAAQAAPPSNPNPNPSSA
jgi:hypothetical protein